MNSHLILLAFVAIGLAGCASPSASVSREPYVKPSSIMLTADQAIRRGIAVTPTAPADPALPRDIDALDASAVTVPAGIKVYTINRAVDPTDRELMHEEHAVYRRESAPRWRLDAASDQKILIGPRVTDGRQDIQPLLTKELTTFLADERRATESNQKAISALFQAVDALTRQQQALLRRETGKANKSEPVVDKPTTVEAESPPASTMPDKK